MNAPRSLVGLALVATAFSTSCLDERVVAPTEDLPFVLAIDRPTVQLVAYARGRHIEEDRVLITNNGPGSLGEVDIVGGVDYVEGRTGWLKAEILKEPGDTLRAFLVLVPDYAEEEQEGPDRAEVVLRGVNSLELKTVVILAQTLPGASFEFSVNPLAFSAFPGDTASSLPLTVRNGGNGTLRIRPPTVRYKSGGTTWLSVSPRDEASLPGEYQVKADPGNLEGGEYTAFLVFESDPTDMDRAEPDSVPVQLNVAKPVLSASAETLAFTFILGTEDPRPETILLRNSGAGDFQALGGIEIEAVEYGEGADGWLAVTPGGEAIVLSASPESLPAGTYSATIRLSSEHGGNASIDVSFVIGTPVLTLQPRTTAFGLVAGDATLPPPRYVGITNTGSGTLESLGSVSLGTLAPTASWIRAEIEGDTIAVTPTEAALSLGEGSYTTRLPVNSTNGGSDTLSITLSVSPGLDPPDLALSPSIVWFSALPAALQAGFRPERNVTIWNSGGGTLADLGTIAAPVIDWGGGPEENWLSATLSGGSAVTLKITRGDLDAGEYSATVTVSSRSGGDPEDVSVTFNVGAPHLTLSSSSASFSGEEGGSASSFPSIGISNTGAGEFSDLGTIYDPVVSPGAGWLAADLAAGDTQVELSADLGAWSVGTHLATVTVSSENGGSETIDVILTVSPTQPDAVLRLSATGATFFSDEGEADPSAAQVISASNEGGGGLGGLGTLTRTITYTDGTDWLSASLAGSTLTLEADPTPPSGDLPAGSYRATVTVSSDDLSIDPEDVSVSLVVLPVAATDDELVLSPGTVRLDGIEGGGGLLEQEVLIYNGGGGGIGGLGNLSSTIAYTDGTDWLSASLAGSTLTLEADPTPPSGVLSPGSYRASVTVSSNKPAIDSKTVSVDFNVGAPDLTLSALSASLNEADLESVITISNTGAGGFADLINIRATDNADWLSASVTGSTLTLEADLTPPSGALDPGSYGASVTVSSDNGGPDETIHVTLTVAPIQPDPDLALSPSTLTFYSLENTQPSPASQAVTAFNLGGGSLGDIEVVDLVYNGAAQGWLEAPAPGQAVGTTFNVRVRKPRLAPGTYEAHIEVNSEFDGNELLEVRLVVRESSLTVVPRTLSFGATVGGPNPDPAMVGIANTGGGSLSNLGTITLGETEYEAGVQEWLEATYVPPDSIEIRAITGDLPVRTYQARVPVVSDLGGNDVVVVDFSVTSGDLRPEFSLSRASMAFQGIYGGDRPAAQSVTASNTGGGPLGPLRIEEINYLQGNQGWLPLEGSISIDSLIVTLQPVVDFDSITADTSRAIVTLASESKGVTLLAYLNVDLILERPVLALSTDRVTFSDLVDSQATLLTQVFMGNDGAGNWAALGEITLGSIDYYDGEPGWLSAVLNPKVGELPEITLEGSAANLPEGNHDAHLPVMSGFGGTDTLTVRLALREPDFSFDSLGLQFVIADSLVEGRHVPLPENRLSVTSESGDTTVVRVGVRLDQETPLTLVGLRVGTIEWTQGKSGWITGAFLDRTTATFNDPAMLSVVVEPRGLASGVYEAKLEVKSERIGLRDMAPEYLRIVLTLR